MTNATIPSRCARLLAAGFALALAAATALAGNQVRLDVSATVLKRATLQTLAQPTSVLVTEGDIARGYVEVPSPAQVAVRNNSRDGYLLMVASRGGFVRQLRVHGLGSDVQMGANGGFIRQPGGSVVRTVLDLGFRFELSDTAQPGVYAWPVQLSVTPL
jgi:hypothetical protein